MKHSYASYIWTASSAGWVVIAYVTGVPEAAIAAAGCGIMAAACLWLDRL